MEIVWAGPNEPEENRIMSLWACNRIWPGQSSDFGPATCMGVIDGDELIAVIAWHNWQEASRTMEFSGAASTSRWLNRRTLTAMFSYPFNRVGCQMVVARVSEHNTPLLRQLKTVGFDQFTIPRLRGREEDEVICTMTAEHWSQSKFNRGATNG